MIRNRKTLKAKALMVTYSTIMLYRTMRDMFRRMQRLPSEPIVINADEIRIWMVGHATVLINFFGTTILTDPVLVYGLPIPKRLVKHGYNADELPPLDYIVISHAHFDHFDKRTLRKLAPTTQTLVIPRNCSDIVQKMPFQKVVELDWETYHDGEVKISSYKPEHWGKRVPWETKNRGYNCYTLEKNGRTVFFGGDTAYGPFFKTIGQKHNIDIALLPIGAYKPALLGSHHMNPDEAHEAFADLQSKHCIPIHYGSFRLTLESMDEPAKRFKRRIDLQGLSDRAHILPNGQSFSFVDALEKELQNLVPNLVQDHATMQE